MKKRLTEKFPFLLPIRRKQRKLFYDIQMLLDKNRYAKRKGPILGYEVCKLKTLMINKNSGQDIIYQQNKVHNLKIVSQTMNNILIYPSETFSFYYLSKKAFKYGKLKKGLEVVNGKIIPTKGGGLCHLSNLLYSAFLRSDLTIIERHGHLVKSFPNPDKNSLDGVDATISEGWLDLKAKNETKKVFQIVITFDDDYMYLKILQNKRIEQFYEIENENINYVKENNGLYKYVDVVKLAKKENQIIKKEKLYTDKILIEYELPKEEVEL